MIAETLHTSQFFWKVCNREQKAPIVIEIVLMRGMPLVLSHWNLLPAKGYREIIFIIMRWCRGCEAHRKKISKNQHSKGTQ